MHHRPLNLVDRHELLFLGTQRITAIPNDKNGSAPTCGSDPGLFPGLAGAAPPAGALRWLAAQPRSTGAGLRVAPGPEPTTCGATNGFINLAAFPSVTPSSERLPPAATKTGASVSERSPCLGREIPGLRRRAEPQRRQLGPLGAGGASPRVPWAWLQQKDTLGGETMHMWGRVPRRQFPACGPDSAHPATPSSKCRCGRASARV